MGTSFLYVLTHLPLYGGSVHISSEVLHEDRRERLE